MTGMIGSGIRATLFQYQHTWKVELIIHLVSIELKQSTLFFRMGSCSGRRNFISVISVEKNSGEKNHIFRDNSKPTVILVTSTAKFTRII